MIFSENNFGDLKISLVKSIKKNGLRFEEEKVLKQDFFLVNFNFSYHYFISTKKN